MADRLVRGVVLLVVSLAASTLPHTSAVDYAPLDAAMRFSADHAASTLALRQAPPASSEGQSSATAAILFALQSHAPVHYYASSSLGSDANSGLAANRSWATLTKVGSAVSSGAVQPGDVIHFCNTDVFYGALSFSSRAAGTNLPPVSFVGDWSCAHSPPPSPASAYPVFTVSTPLKKTDVTHRGTILGTSFVVLTFNLSAYARLQSAGAAVSSVYADADGFTYFPARYPNFVDFNNRVGVARREFVSLDGYGSTNQVLYSAALKLARNDTWRSAVIHVRSVNWQYEAAIVKQSIAPNALQLTTPLTYPPQGEDVATGKTFGFYFDASADTNATLALSMLDAPGEFWYDPATRLLHLVARNSSEASNIQAGSATISVVFNTSTAAIRPNGLSSLSLALSHLRIVRSPIGLSMGAANATTMRWTVSDVLVEEGGIIGGCYSAPTCGSFTLSAVSVRNSPTACFLAWAGVGTVTNSSFVGCGMSVGAAQNYAGVYAPSTVTVVNNTIANTAYAGGFGQATWKGNYISNTMRVLDDGGGIYAFAYGTVISGNTVVNSSGNVVSSYAPTALDISYYVDNFCHAGATVANNVASGDRQCVFVNGCPSVTVINNTCYDGGLSFGIPNSPTPANLYTTRFVNNTLFRNASRSLNPYPAAPFVQLSGYGPTLAGNLYCDRSSPAYQASTAPFIAGVNEYETMYAWQRSFPATKADVSYFACAPYAPVIVPTFVPTVLYGAQLLADRPVLYWPLNATAGAAAVDYSGHNASGTLSGPYTLDELSLVHNSDHSVQLGPGGAVTGSNTFAAPQFTLALWFSTQQAVSGLAYIQAAGGGYSTVQLYMVNGSVVAGVYNGSQQAAVSASSGYNDGQAHLAAVVLSATAGLTLYMDGQKAAALPLTTSWAPSLGAGALVVGFSNCYGWPLAGDTSAYFVGSVGEVALFDKPLNATRLLQYYRVAANPSSSDANSSGSDSVATGTYSDTSSGVASAAGQARAPQWLWHGCVPMVALIVAGFGTQFGWR